MNSHCSVIHIYLKSAGIDRTGLVDIGNNLDQIVCLRGCVHGGFNGVAPLRDVVFNSLPGGGRQRGTVITKILKLSNDYRLCIGITAIHGIQCSEEHHNFHLA